MSHIVEGMLILWDIDSLFYMAVFTFKSTELKFENSFSFGVIWKRNMMFSRG